MLAIDWIASWMPDITGVRSERVKFKRINCQEDLEHVLFYMYVFILLYMYIQDGAVTLFSQNVFAVFRNMKYYNIFIEVVQSRGVQYTNNSFSVGGSASKISSSPPLFKIELNNFFTQYNFSNYFACKSIKIVILKS